LLADVDPDEGPEAMTGGDPATALGRFDIAMASKPAQERLDDALAVVLTGLEHTYCS
jgi:hypothetical protein